MLSINLETLKLINEKKDIINNFIINNNNILENNQYLLKENKSSFEYELDEEINEVSKIELLYNYNLFFFIIAG